MSPAQKLTRLQSALRDYDHDAFLEQLQQFEKYESEKQQQSSGSDKKEQSPKDEQPPPDVSVPIPRGFYIHGNVGTGKSLLLNHFYHSHPSTKKRRLHFHSFLQEIHQRIHGLNQQLLQQNGRSFHVDTSAHRNPILRIAEQLSTEATVLCLDEFQVTDVADAMILSQFFGELWRRGVVVVATSNRPPEDLYEGGLNREYFLPFVGMLEQYCLVHRLGDETSDERDYRRIRAGVDGLGGEQTSGYFYVAEEGPSTELHRLFQSFVEDGHANDSPLALDVHFGRTISIPSDRYHSNTIARFTFDELCTTELGSADYHAVANHFRIVLIEDIPQLTLEHPDRARRFITLIDELYEAECCLACSAVDVPDRLFVGKPLSDETKKGHNETSDKDINGKMLAVDVAQVQGTAVSELASVKELSFAFRRAASRLLEMCSETLWEEKGVAKQRLSS
ncbi:hypothetical protein ACHAXT_008212 [Thalassiosira profunda]